MRWRSAALVLPLLAMPLALAACVTRHEPIEVPQHTMSATEHRELMQRQARLGPVAREIAALVDPAGVEGPIASPLPGGDDRYGEVRLDLEADRVEVLWAGPLPAEVRAVIRRYPDVVVDVLTVRYSSNQLQRAGRRVLAGIEAQAFGSDVTAPMIEHDVEAGRIVVHVVDPAGRWTEEALQPRVEALAKVPTTVIVTRESPLAPLG